MLYPAENQQKLLTSQLYLVQGKFYLYSNQVVNHEFGSEINTVAIAT